MPKMKKQLSNIPDFDILSEDAKTVLILLRTINYEGYKNVKINKKPV